MLAAGLAALSLHIPVTHAAMLATKAQCVAACGGAISSGCGVIMRPLQFAGCRKRLLRQCRRLGTATICPAPPPTTTTTTTTTTTSTTTLLLSQAAFFAGTWQFSAGYPNPCGLPAPGVDTLTVAVNPAVLDAAFGYLASMPHVLFTGGVLYSYGGALQLTGEMTDTQGCVVVRALTLEPNNPLATPGSEQITVTCPGQATYLGQCFGQWRRTAL
jgi:hypothetical protein